MTRFLGAALLVVLSGCSDPPAPLAPAVGQSAAPAAAMLPAGQRPVDQKALEKVVEYSQAHPWGENTGTAAVYGQVRWAEGSGPEEPVVRRGILLKGIKGTSTEGIYFSGRTNEHGEFRFERIRGGEYKLTDDIARGFRWRLRVEVKDSAESRFDLTPANNLALRDDFPDEGRGH